MLLSQSLAIFSVSPLHALRVELELLEQTQLPQLTIFFPEYIVAADYNLELGSINIATSPTPTNGDLTSTLVGTRVYLNGLNILPFPPNAIAVFLPPTLLEPFANIINNVTIYFRPTASYLKHTDGSVVDILLNPVPINVVNYGLPLYDFNMNAF